MSEICHNNLYIRLSNPAERFLLKALPTYENLKHKWIRNVMSKDDISLQLGYRWSAALKKRFPERNTTKMVARCFDVEIRTARSWLEGQAPTVKYVYLAGQKLGNDFIAEILTPDNQRWHIDKTLRDLEVKICQLGEQIRSLREGQ